MADTRRSPAELREMFGTNLRKLAEGYPSVSELSRLLRINRTQFNRYLSGESFPRPDVLDRICAFFKVDARVLLEPVENIISTSEPLRTAFLQGFLGAGIEGLSEDQFPNGFYRFSRRSFVDENRYVVGLNHLHRDNGVTVVKGFESRAALKLQGFPTDRYTREYRGVMMRQEPGVVLMASRRDAMTSSYNYISPVAAFKGGFWVGFATRAVPEGSGGLRITRLAYEFVGASFRDGLSAARTCGFSDAEHLPPFHRRLLKPDETFV